MRRAALAIAALLWPSAAQAQVPWQHLDDTARGAFTGTALLYHGAAVALTAGLSASGGDHAARVWVQRGVEGSGGAASLAQAAVVGGYALPLAAPLLLGLGHGLGSRDAARAGAASVQALALTLGTTFVLKAITGRPFPLDGGDPRAPDRLDHPGAARRWGPPSLRAVAWPSGHTAVGFALASSLTWSQPGRWWVPALTYPIAAALGVGMLVGDHHWASDVAAGALLGQVIGAAAGRAFAPGAGDTRPLAVLPLPQGVGLVASGSW